MLYHQLSCSLAELVRIGLSEFGLPNHPLLALVWLRWTIRDILLAMLLGRQQVLHVMRTDSEPREKFVGSTRATAFASTAAACR